MCSRLCQNSVIHSIFGALDCAICVLAKAIKELQVFEATLFEDMKIELFEGEF